MLTPAVPPDQQSAAGEFPPVRATVRDGRSVTIRSIRPDDGT
jgi:hypothetical protein